MREFKVPYTTIVKLEKHPNADRLEIAYCYAWPIIVQKDKYKVGDNVIFIPPDSILPQDLEDRLFPADSKIKLTNHRVRQIRIRQVASLGMIVSVETVAQFLGMDKIRRLGTYELDEDLSEILKITKYEPPQRSNEPREKILRNRPKENSRFHQYGGITNIKWVPNAFEGQEVVIQDKLHGSNCRASYTKTEANTLWKKVLRLFKLLPAYEHCYGSNRVQLQERKKYKGFYGENIYSAVLNRVGAFDKLKAGETIFGELIGEGVQANYHYGHKDHHFVLFDVKIEKEDGSQEYLNPEQAEAYAKERGFDFVPVLYRGPYDAEIAKKLSMGPDPYYPAHPREGVVVKARHNYSINGQKNALKLISEVYLADKSNTDEH